MNLILLIRSIFLISVSGLLSVFIGFLISVFLWRCFYKKIKEIIVVFLLLTIIPIFIHIQAWIFFGDLFCNLLNTVFGLSLDFTGIPGYLIVNAFAYLPLSIGFCLFGFSVFPSETAQLCMLEGDRFYIFCKVVIPAIIPYVCSGFSLIFILSLYDFSVASAFGVSLIGLELLAHFSYGAGILEMLILSIPSLLVGLFFVSWIGIKFFRSDFVVGHSNDILPFKNNKKLKILSALGFLFLLLFAVLPSVSLVIYGLKERSFVGVLIAAASEIKNSLFLSLTSALIIVILSSLFAVTGMDKKRFVVLVFISMFIFAMPTALLSLLCIRFINMAVPNLYNSAFTSIVIFTLKYLFIGLLSAYSLFTHTEQELKDSSLLYCKDIWHRVLVYFSMYKKWILAVFILCSAFVMGDFTIPILSALPGFQTFSVKIFNYLHYGASETIAVLCLFLLCLYLLMIFLIRKLMRE